ncbi:MAG: inorganic phosphate transporter [Hyphomicrobiales bacterium]|nr:MAG: inorganic phosphate transporter [Hyphomicrobiales bacterium]
MDFTVLIFLTSGLFLGWSLGANDAANVFGTAVGTRMVRFATAAVVSSIFIILGSVLSGAGAAHTLGKLGSINALAGSFMAALAAAMTVYAMTKLELPVSTSQAIVGAIIGWNLFSGSVTDANALIKILGTWVACPILAAAIAAPIYLGIQRLLSWAKLHILRRDVYTRIALILAGAFGSYSLGANNIANVMGVFVPASPFTDFKVADAFTFTGIQQLFLLGAIAIAVGVFTYSKRVMLTVGGGLMPLSPVAAWVVVISHSIVLTLFASEGLEHFLASHDLPTIPLVPVSSSQAVVGAVIGIGLLRGGRNVRWRVLGNISMGWVTTPLISAVLCFVSLFFLQNVFNQQVYTEVTYSLSPKVMDHLVESSLPAEDLTGLKNRKFNRATEFLQAIGQRTYLTGYQQKKILEFSETTDIEIRADIVDALPPDWLSAGQIEAVRKLKGRHFKFKWAVADALEQLSDEWRLYPDSIRNKAHNKQIKAKLDYIYRTFKVSR